MCPRFAEQSRCHDKEAVCWGFEVLQTGWLYKRANFCKFQRTTGDRQKNRWYCRYFLPEPPASFLI